MAWTSCFAIESQGNHFVPIPHLSPGILWLGPIHFVKNANHYGILDSHAEDVIRAVTMLVNEVRK
jgi:hypothetical protein